MQHERNLAHMPPAELTAGLKSEHQLNVRVTKELNKRLELVCVHGDRNKADVVREALDLHVTRLEIELEIKGGIRYGKAD